MDQEELFFETEEEAIRDDIQRHGGFKEIGHQLKPTKSPADAATWLRNYTNRNQDDAINYRELLVILDKALSNQRSSFLAFLGQKYGFRIEWLQPENELVSVVREIRAAKAEDRAREVRLARLLERAEAIAAKQVTR